MVIVIERLTDVLGLAILALIGSFAFIGSLFYQILIIVLFFIIFFMFIVLTSKKVFFKVSVILEKLPVIKNYVKYLENIYQSSKTLITIKSLTFIILISVISWFFECLAFYLLLVSLNVPFSIYAATFIFSFSSIFGSATFLPGGLGSAESSMIILLIITGALLSTATLATVIIRLGTLFYGISMGIIALILVNRLIASRQEQKSILS